MKMQDVVVGETYRYTAMRQNRLCVVVQKLERPKYAGTRVRVRWTHEQHTALDMTMTELVMASSLQPAPAEGAAQ